MTAALARALASAGVPCCAVCGVPLDRRTMEFDADYRLVCPECYLRAATDSEITLALLCAAMSDADRDSGVIPAVRPVPPDVAMPPARLSVAGWALGVLLGCAGGLAVWLTMGTR